MRSLFAVAAGGEGWVGLLTLCVAAGGGLWWSELQRAQALQSSTASDERFMLGVARVDPVRGKWRSLAERPRRCVVQEAGLAQPRV